MAEYFIINSEFLGVSLHETVLHFLHFSSEWCMRCFLLLLFSCSVMSDSWWPHGQHLARLPCPSPSLGAFSNSCPLSQWCHQPILSSVVPFSSCLQSFPASRIFSNELALCIRWPKYWSFSFRISSSNEYSGLISFRIDWFDLLAAQATLESSSTPQSKSINLAPSPLYGPALTSIPDTGKTIALTTWPFVSKVMSLLFNMLSRLVTAFLPRSKCLLISWLQSPSTVILESKKIKSLTVSIVSHLNLPWSDGTRCHDLHFLNVEF